MAVSPPGGPTGPAFKPLTPFGPHPARKSSLDGGGSSGTPERAEREAMDRINRAQRTASDAEHELQDRLDRSKEAYTDESEVQSIRHEESMMAQKQKGYEAIRDLKKQQEAELRQIRREGEKQLADLKTFYNSEISSKDRDGNEKLHDIELERSKQVDYEQKSAKFEVDDMKASHANQIEQLRQHEQETVDNLTETSHKHLENLKQGVTEAREQADEKYTQAFQDTLNKNQESLDRVRGLGTKQLVEIRRDTAHKLSAYKARQKDPFYQMVNVGARLSDEGDYFMLTATIPEHEQQNVSISLKGNNIVLSGYRRNEEKLEDSPGRYQSTSSYQSYQESFPLTWPVEGKLMTKEFDGDDLIVRVPKKNEHVYQPHQSKRPERARVERPKFPENLPLGKEKPHPEDPEPSPRTKGSGTLT